MVPWGAKPAALPPLRSAPGARLPAVSCPAAVPQELNPAGFPASHADA
jgi:hypothetical protein